MSDLVDRGLTDHRQDSIPSFDYELRETFFGDGDEEAAVEAGQIDEEREADGEMTEADSIWDDAAGGDRAEGVEKYEGFYELDEADELERRGEEEEGEEVGEVYEGIPLSLAGSAAEKLEEEARQALTDRDAMMGKLRELLLEHSELRRHNRLLELWVSRHVRKTRQRPPPTEEDKDGEETERAYREALHAYKLQIDDIMDQQEQLASQIQSYRDKVRLLREEDERIFGELLDREKELAVGLVFAKSGRRITEKVINELTHRQVSRREILARDRYKYILLQHCLTNLQERLASLETLGEGMTTMDYEALRIANVGYKDKLDERDQELERLRFKIEDVVNGVAHYKEKEVSLEEDIELEEAELRICRERTANTREQVNRLHSALKDLRDSYNEKKQEAGLLIAQPKLREMERTMKLLDALKTDIDIIEQEIR